MAITINNEQLEYGVEVGMVVPSGTARGDLVVVGSLVGMCDTTPDVNLNATVNFKGGVWTLYVNAINGSGNTAVAAGDKLYYTAGDKNAAASPPVSGISEKATGVFCGYALDTLTSGTNAQIRVKVTRP